jgi:cellobiose transport system substrate-binding protein
VGLAPRRVGVLAGVLIAVTVLATACGSGKGSGGGNEPVTLQVNLFGTFGYKEAGLFDEYQRLHPNIKIAYSSVEFEQNYYQALQTHLAANSGLGDIQGIEVGRIAELVKTRADRFVNFNDHGGSALKDNYFPWKWQAATTADGKTIGLGTDIGPMALCYRRDLFQKAGLPTDREAVAKLWPDWASYVRTGRTYTANAPARTAFMDTASGMFNAMIGQSPTQYYDQSGKPVYDSNPLVKRAWDLSMQAVANKETAKLQQFQTAWNQAFSSGSFATIACPSWMIGYIQGQAGDKGAGKWDVTAAPGGTGNWGGSYLAVPKAARHVTAAVELAKWLTAPEQQVKLFLKQGSFPSSPAAIADPRVAGATSAYFNNAPVGRIFGDSARNLPVAVLGPKDGVIKDNFTTGGITRVEQQGMSPDASWDKVMQDLRNALNA